MKYIIILVSGVWHSDSTVLHSMQCSLHPFSTTVPKPLWFCIQFSHSKYGKEVSITEELKYFPGQMSYSLWHPQLLHWWCSGNICLNGWMHGWMAGWMDSGCFSFQIRQLRCKLVSFCCSCCGLFSLSPCSCPIRVWMVPTQHYPRGWGHFYIRTAGIVRFSTSGHSSVEGLDIPAGPEADTMLSLGLHCSGGAALRSISCLIFCLQLGLWRHSTEVVLTLDSELGVEGRDL